jgi:hypothetical protein
MQKNIVLLRLGPFLCLNRPLNQISTSQMTKMMVTSQEPKSLPKAVRYVPAGPEHLGSLLRMGTTILQMTYLLWHQGLDLNLAQLVNKLHRDYPTHL